MVVINLVELLDGVQTVQGALARFKEKGAKFFILQNLGNTYEVIEAREQFAILGEVSKRAGVDQYLHPYGTSVSYSVYEIEDDIPEAH